MNGMFLLTFYAKFIEFKESRVVFMGWWYLGGKKESK
jgi:hypothetical protein